MANPLSVVIPSGDPDNLEVCVAALMQCQPGFDPARLVVVTDGPMPAARSRVPEGTRVVDGPVPFVFARNVNLGVQACAPADVLVMADDVALLTPCGLDALAGAQEQHPEVGVLSVGIVGAMPVASQRHVPEPLLRIEHDWLSFVCVLVPRRTWQEVGILDESLDGYGYDDVDYSWRVRQAGLQLGVTGACAALHNVRQPSVYRSRLDFDSLAARNRELFRRKWGRVPD